MIKTLRRCVLFYFNRAAIMCGRAMLEFVCMTHKVAVRLEEAIFRTMIHSGRTFNGEQVSARKM